MSKHPSGKSRPPTRRFIRKTFFRGLAALLPAVLTVFILVKAVQFVNGYVAKPLTKLPVYILERINAESPHVDSLKELANSLSIRVLAFLVAIVLVCLLGALLLRAVGRKVWSLFEHSFGRVPVVKQIYPRVKRLIDFLFGDRQVNEFRSVVAIEYPRKGIYSIGFVTGEGLPDIADRNARNYVTVFMPSSPTPLTGYVIIVPASEIIRLSLTTEEVLSMLVSGGVISPRLGIPKGLSCQETPK